LYDEQVIVCPARPAREVVVLYPNSGVGFVVVLDDVAWRPKMLWEMLIMDVASERLWP
jgi:hypothetical protein